MMKPEEILKLIAAARGTAICVPTMTTAPAWRKIAPDDLSVGCVGFMGGASAMGLGLALGAPDRRVIVFDGDGSLLMQLGSLATIAGAAPRNFTHLLFKNGVYHTSGSQETPGGQGVDFAAMAKAAGYRATCTISTLEELKKRLPGLLGDDGPILAQLITGLAESTPMNSPPGTPFHQQVANLRAKVAAGP
jgi:phosphonopyruvate decarboxylase